MDAEVGESLPVAGTPAAEAEPCALLQDPAAVQGSPCHQPKASCLEAAAEAGPVPRLTCRTTSSSLSLP